MIRKVIFSLGMIVFIMLSASCSSVQTIPTQQANMANPASVYCEQNGGKLDMRQDSSGGVSGVCVFTDGTECDEWAYFRNECKPGDSLAIPTPSITTTPPIETTNEQIIFYSNRGDGYDNIYMMEIGTANVTSLTQNQSNTFSGPFSPDGTHILFTGFGLTHSFVGIMNADGTGQMDLTNLPDSDEAFPAWSPEGSQIAFTSRRDGNNEIYIMNTDGSDAKRITNNPKDDFAPVWSPDGSRIAFVSDRDNQTGIYSLYIMNIDGSDVLRLTNDNSIDYSPDWSPDGMTIAYHSIRDGQADIYTINIESIEETNLTNSPTDDYAPRWSPDGRQIAFQTNRDGSWDVYVMDADGGNPVNLTQNPADDQSPYWKP